MTIKNCWLIHMNFYNLFCMFSYDQSTVCKKKNKLVGESHDLYNLAYPFSLYNLLTPQL